MIPSSSKDSSYMYPWGYAPKWAEYAATDPDGRANWFSHRPIFDQITGSWMPSEGQWERIHFSVATLRQRPA